MRKRLEKADEDSDDLYEQSIKNNDSDENHENTISPNDSQIKQRKLNNSYLKKLSIFSKAIKSNVSINQSKISNTYLRDNYFDNDSHENINCSHLNLKNNQKNMNSINESNLSSTIKLSYMDADSEILENNQSKLLNNSAKYIYNEKIKSHKKNDLNHQFNINHINAGSIIPNPSWNSSCQSMNKNRNNSNILNTSNINNSNCFKKTINNISNINENDSIRNDITNSNFNLIPSYSQTNSVSTNLSQYALNNSSNYNHRNNNNNKKEFFGINFDDEINNSSNILNNNDYRRDDNSFKNNSLKNLSINDDRISDIIPSHIRKLELKIETPFDYQMKIFEEIKDRNAIVFMETGKGKTFISIMLIKYFLNQELKKIKIKNSKYNNNLINSNSFLSKNNDLLSGIEPNIGNNNEKQSMKSKIMQMAQQKNSEKLASAKNGESQELQFKLKVIFLVCEVVLLDQQSKVIEENLDDFNLKVAVMNSSKKFSRVSANLESFRKFWDTHSIFVSTPSIVYKLLSIGYLNIDKISLLIFDECHHTDGNHPYNVLMNEFYFFHKEKFPGSKLPQILGLTASPLKKKIDKDVITTGKKALETLCENLDSVMVIDPEVLDFGNEIKSEEDDIKMLSGNEAKRIYKEIVNHKSVVSFDALRDFMLESLLYPFYKYAYEQEFLLNEEEPRTKEQYKLYIEKKFDSENLTEYNKTLSQMKVFYDYRKRHYLFAVMEKLQLQIFMLVENLNFNSVLELIEEYQKMYKNELEIMHGSLYRNSQKIGSFEEEKDIKFEQKDLIQINSIFEHFLAKAKKKKIDYTSQRLTQLLDDLGKIIDKDIQFNKDHRVIIFVSNRVVSEMLSKLINNFLDKKYNSNCNKKNEFYFTQGEKEEIAPNFIQNQASKKYQSVSVVGLNKRKNENSFNPTNSLNKMNENVTKFKKGEAQILVGTSTVEEGIDVRSCDYVIVYTELKTAKSYIQMKGRARRVGAIFSIYTDNPKKMQETIADFVELIIFIRKQFNKNSIVSDFRSNKIEKKFNLSDDEGEYFYIESSKAKVTVRNSSILFNEFLQSLQLLDKTAKQIVNYQDEKMPRIDGCPTFWNCTFRLNSILIDPIPIPADFKTDKNTALASCYVMYFDYLYQIGKLNDSFKFKK
jgi:ERCC4-related helicase